MRASAFAYAGSGQDIVVTRPQRLVLALVALVPYHGLLQIIPHTTAVRAWKEALIVAALVATFIAPATARGPRGRRIPQWSIPLASFIIVGVASAAAQHNITALYGLKVYFLAVALPLVLWRCPFDAAERNRFVTILMVNGVIAALVGIAQQLIGADRLHALGYEYNSVIRFTGDFLRSFSTFDQPFAFAYFEMIVLVVCLPVALSDRLSRRNRAFLVLTPVLVGGLLTTFTRGAWLGAAVGLAVIATQRLRGRVVLLLAGAAAAAAVAVVVLPDRFVEPATQAQSADSRLDRWRDNVDELLDRPGGHGIGTTGATAAKLNELGYRSGTVFQPDNHYFTVGFELGLPGLAWFIITVGTVLWWIQRAAGRLGGADRALAVGASALVVAALVACMAATFFQIFPSDVLVWTIIGVISAAAPESTSRQKLVRKHSARETLPGGSSIAAGRAG